MSKEYDKYIKEHKVAVMKAYTWLLIHQSIRMRNMMPMTSTSIVGIDLMQ